MAKKLDIFISYKRGEGDDAVREIENYLTRKKNYSVFRDVDKIEGGEDWNQEIIRSIRRSDIFILLLTPLALSNREVEKELVNLYLEIIGDLSKLNYNKVGIVGIGGVGKTQLAVEFFYRYSYAFDKGLFWIDGNDPTKWLEHIVSIARDYLDLEIPKEEDIKEAEKNKRYFIEFQKYCSENGSKMLLLIDNIIDPIDLNKENILFPGDSNGKFTLLSLG